MLRFKFCLCSQLFGEIDFDDEVSPDATDTGKRDEDGEAVEGNGSAMDTDDQEGEASENGSVSNGSKSTAPSTRVWAEECNYHPKKIFQKVTFLWKSKVWSLAVR